MKEIVLMLYIVDRQDLVEIIRKRTKDKKYLNKLIRIGMDKYM